MIYQDNKNSLSSIWQSARETALDKDVFNVVIEEDENVDNFGADADPEPLSKPVI